MLNYIISKFTTQYDNTLHGNSASLSNKFFNFRMNHKFSICFRNVFCWIYVIYHIILCSYIYMHILTVLIGEPLDCIMYFAVPCIKLQFAFPFNKIIYIILVFLHRTSFIHMMYIKFFSSAMKTIVPIYWITTDNDTIQILP